jgi:PIN domain nuclease of toxin-antitoxin system
MATNEQIRAAEDALFVSTPEAQAYRTDENLDLLFAYIQDAWGEVATANAACWEIAFKALQGKLKKIPGYKPPVSAEMRARIANTPSYQHRELYARDEAYRIAFDQIAAEEADRQELLAWARVYRTMADNDPNEVTRRYAEEPGFAEAVQKLIDEGLI